MRRTIIVFIVIVAIAAAVALFARCGPGKITPVTGLIGSEKAPHLADGREQQALAGMGHRASSERLARMSSLPGPT
jgi:hypothetical protein